MGLERSSLSHLLESWNKYPQTETLLIGKCMNTLFNRLCIFLVCSDGGSSTKDSGDNWIWLEIHILRLWLADWCSSWKGRWSHISLIVLWTVFWEAQVDSYCTSGRALADKLQRQPWRQVQTCWGRVWLLQGQRERQQPECLQLWTLRSNALSQTSAGHHRLRFFFQPCTEALGTSQVTASFEYQAGSL